MISHSIQMIDNKLILGKEELYKTLEVQLESVIQSWKISLFSFEWLTPEGAVRELETLPDAEQEKYRSVVAAIQNNVPLERPILGIGMMDNIEIGSRRDVLLTVAAQGAESLSVHVPVRHLEDFMPYS